jgi:hypothetical protein
MAYARGLIPVRYEGGAPYQGAAVRCAVNDGYGSNIFIGDPVVLVAGGGLAIPEAGTSNDSMVDGGVYPQVELATAGSASVIYGVVVGVEVSRGERSNKHLPLSTGGTVMVARATPDLIFTCGEDGTIDAIELVDIGQTFELAAGGGGDTAYGYSSWVINSDSQGTDFQQVYLVGIANFPGNADNVDHATETDTVWEVKIQSIQQGYGALGLGV